MFNSNKLVDQMKITPDKLGNGAFGSVYVAVDNNNNNIAVKCESKEKKDNNSLTLLREFKISRKIFIINKYINISESNINESYKNIIENLENNNSIKIYNHITKNDLLLIPPELNERFKIDYLYKIIPQVYSYIECNDFNFLTMLLCGDNFENIIYY